MRARRSLRLPPISPAWVSAASAAVSALAATATLMLALQHRVPPTEPLRLAPLSAAQAARCSPALPRRSAGLDRVLPRRTRRALPAGPSGGKSGPRSYSVNRKAHRLRITAAPNAARLRDPGARRLVRVLDAGGHSACREGCVCVASRAGRLPNRRREHASAAVFADPGSHVEPSSARSDGQRRGKVRRHSRGDIRP